jgi:hypothetical protein
MRRVIAVLTVYGIRSAHLLHSLKRPCDLKPKDTNRAPSRVGLWLFCRRAHISTAALFGAPSRSIVVTTFDTMHGKTRT